MHARLRVAASLTAFVSGLFAIGCAPLPDASPFAAATAELSSAVRASGRASADEVRRMTNGDKRANDLEAAWKARIAVMDAMVLYADSLVDIVNSTRQAGDAAAALADKVGNLATAAGIINPAAGASLKVSADVAKLVWTHIARAKGAASLRDSLAAAQPAIDIIAETIAADNADLRKAVDAALSNQESQLLDGNASLNEVVGFHENALKVKAGIIKRATSSGVPSLDAPGIKSDLDAVDRLVATTKPDYDAFLKQVDAARERHRVARELVSATDDAIARWGVAHRQLGQALEKGRGIDLNSLTDAVVDVRNIIKKVREQ